MMAGTLKLERDGPSAWIWIDHAERRNALTLAMWKQFRDMLDDVAADPPRAVIVTGVGDRSFAAGADIAEFESTKANPEAARASFLAVDDVCRRLRALPVPVIAAINGHAVGAGLELAVAADFRLASPSSRLGITASRLGITIGHGHIRRLVDVVGAPRALDLLMTGRLLDADEAYRIGLVHAVTEDVRAAAAHLAETLAERAPLSVAWAKQAVARVLADPDLSTVADDAAESIRCFDTADFWEAVRAFREKRPPNFGPVREGSR
jgi:enoyl-CoA hydratase